MYTFDANYFFEKICVLLKEKHKSQKDLCEYLGIGKQAFTNWKSGFSKSYTKYLPQIASFFDVSVDYLIGQTDKKEKPTNYGELSERKKDFIRKIVNMSDSQFERLEQILALVEQKEL